MQQQHHTKPFVRQFATQMWGWQCNACSVTSRLHSSQAQAQRTALQHTATLNHQFMLHPMKYNQMLRKQLGTMQLRARNTAKTWGENRDIKLLLTGLRAALSLHAPYESKWKDKPLLCEHCEQNDGSGGTINMQYPCPTVRSILHNFITNESEITA